MKKTGELIHSKLKETDIGDLSLGAEEKEKLDILEQIEKSKSFSLIKLLKENPEVIISELNKVLSWLSIVDNWFVALTQIEASDGAILVRFTISPPKDKKLSVVVDETDESKKILLEDKVSVT